jgi:hypothetical protein
MRRIQRQFVLLGVLAASCQAIAVPLPQLGTVTPVAALVPPSKIQVAPCAAPAQAFTVEDYRGPLSQLVTRFSERVERPVVHVPRHRNAVQPCVLDAAGKFQLFLDQEKDPINFLGATIDAAEAHFNHEDPTFGQGAQGYSKRYSAALADRASSDFFGVFLYPTIFHQDPRYYRLGQGSFQSRLGHALSHRWVTRTDSGRRTFNFSEWSANVSSKAISNLYHPGNPRGFGSTATRVGWSVGTNMMWDVVREFWPEIARKLKLPFNTHDTEVATRSRSPQAPAPVPAAAVPAVAPFRTLPVFGFYESFH